MESRTYEQAHPIHETERDFKLEIDQPDWLGEGRPRPAFWTPENDGRWLSRRIKIDEPSEESATSNETPGPRDIKELLLRFPSAPIHGIHRLHEYHVNEGKSENFHSYRVLLHPERDPDTQIRRIYLMHNGLNETESMGLYYKLASYLIHQDDEDGATACILRPFPGHLTRSRFAGFSETPLDHYLWDGSHLFRQFLRYMIETQWLLSVIVRRSTYRCISGLNLLSEHAEPSMSRLEDPILAEEIRENWMALYGASESAVKTAHSREKNAAGLEDPPPDDSFELAVTSLRAALSLTARLDGELRPTDHEPDIHVIGYSLGGFTAQSVFMSWPFLIASCSTLLSGGALKELAPTAFAHPEEWQSVLHSLRYELDDAMLTQRYQIEGREIQNPDRVSGIEFDLFLFLKSTFYEVFQQEYKGSFQTRLAAFRRRMLFIVGGNDPIVRPRSVLDSGPPDGINMFAIGGLGHFLGSRSYDDEEEQQRSFWLPEMGRLMNTLANEAAAMLAADRRDTWLEPDLRLPESEPAPTTPISNSNKAIGDGGFGRLSASERLAIDSDGVLSAQPFQRCLDDLLHRTDARRGILFLFRNEVPTALLDDHAIQQLAAGLHHNDAAIAKYVEGLRRRRTLIRNNPERVLLILPWNVKKILEFMDAHPGHPSQAEGAGGQMPKRVQLTPQDIWQKFQETCKEFTNENPNAVRVCDGRLGVKTDKSGIPPLETADLARIARRKLEGEEDHLYVTDAWPSVKPSLPDCWVWMSPQFLGGEEDEILTVEQGREKLCKVITQHYEDKQWFGNRLRRDDLRIVTVSHARYNPRFRGQLVVNPGVARNLLLHATLCIATSVPFQNYDLEKGELRSGVDST